jgi:hypothetical protein
LQYIPDVAMGQNSRSMVAKLPPTSKDDEYCDDSCKSSDMDKQGLQYAPRVASEATTVIRIMMNRMKRAMK